MTSKNKKLVFFPKLPKQLVKKDIISSAGMGLYQLFSGWEPENIPIGELKTARINLSEKAFEILSAIEKYDNFKSKNEIFLHALTIVAENPYLTITKT